MHCIICYHYFMSKFTQQYILFTVLSLGLLCIIFWVIFPLFAYQAKIFVSPLPDFLTLADNSEVSTIDLWYPDKKFLVMRKNLSLTAISALSYDLNTNKVLFAKTPDKKLPLASLTKIMTAVIALEHFQENQIMDVPPNALVGEDSMGLDAGEKLNMKELLYGLILHSGNDAAETLAVNYEGGRNLFIAAMNLKAQALGLKNTHFTNPTGLEGDGNQYTTAFDLLVITHYALTQYPLFKKVAATAFIDIPATSTHKEYSLNNETNLLTSYPGVKGVKTGYTPEAGLCLVTYLDYGGHQIIAVLLGSHDRRGEMEKILDYSLKMIGITPPYHA